MEIKPVSLARGIRTALNLSDSAPVGWDQVLAVLQEILLDQGPLGVVAVLKNAKAMWPDAPPSEDDTDPEEQDPKVISFSAQSIQDILYKSDADDMGVAAGAVFPIALSPLIKQIMRRNKKFYTTIIAPHTADEGREIERLIQADYILQHPNNRVLMDFDVWNNVTKTWRPLGGLPDEDLVKTNMVSPAGDRYKPDILDLTSREVFEIKPLSKVFTGLAQLYLHYLIPVNTAILTFALAKSFMEGMAYPYTGSFSLPDQPFLPGKDFKSPRWYPHGNGWVFAMLAGPGVIGYQVVSMSGVRSFVLDMDAVEDRKRLMELMAAMIAGGVAALGARNVSGRPFTPDDLPPLSAAGGPDVPISTDLTFWLIFLGFAIVVTGGLLAVTAVPEASVVIGPVLAVP